MMLTAIGRKNILNICSCTSENGSAGYLLQLLQPYLLYARTFISLQGFIFLAIMAALFGRMMAHYGRIGPLRGRNFNIYRNSCIGSYTAP